MGTDIATGTSSPTPDPVHPIGAALVPGVQRPTPIAEQPSGPTIPGRDTTGEFQAQMRAGEADCRAAQAAGMAAEDDRRGGYQAPMLPLGGHTGTLMGFPPSPLDPGAGVGNTMPAGGFYDPPRGYGGEQGAPGLSGEAL